MPRCCRQVSAFITEDFAVLKSFDDYSRLVLWLRSLSNHRRNFYSGILVLEERRVADRLHISFVLEHMVYIQFIREACRHQLLCLEHE